MNDEVSLSVTEFLDMSVREVSGRLCEEICKKIQEGRVPMASYVADGRCDDLGRVRLTVTLTKVDENE